jgi:hypothetical protein
VTGSEESAGRSAGLGFAPSTSRCAPSAATIAPLSVHSPGRGTRSDGWARDVAEGEGELGTRWRRLTVGKQALLVVAHLRNGETYTDLAAGFGIGTTTVFRYIREAVDALAAQALTLEQAIEIAARKAFVILDGTLLRIDRVGMCSGRDRPYYSGKAKCHA